MFCTSRLAFLRFTFHWYLPVVIKNIKNMHAVSTNQIAEILPYNDNVFIICTQILLNECLGKVIWNFQKFPDLIYKSVVAYVLLIDSQIMSYNIWKLDIMMS